MKRRKPSKHIERLPSGRFRVKGLGTFDFEAQALHALHGGDLAGFWPEFAVRRRTQVRDWANDESKWELYVAGDPIASVPFATFSKRDAKAWLARMYARGLATQTLKNALTLIRVVCADAVDSELLGVNPFVGLKIHKSREARSVEGWTILDPDEQIALLKAVSADESHMVAFALHTGLRNSELWSLRTRDLDLEARLVTVRFSKNDQPPKGGRIRRVPLFGAGFDAAVIAVERGNEFAWPSPRTLTRRYASSQPSRWSRWLKAAGIKRGVRFYDLRHTCATSLLAGWWGRKWSLDEVQQMLGHSSIKVTERYAHLIDDTLHRAGAATPGMRPTAWDNEGASSGFRTPDLRFTKAWGDERFSRVARRALLEKYDGPHERLAREVLLCVDEAMAGRVDLKRLAKAERIWEEARHVG